MAMVGGHNPRSKKPVTLQNKIAYGNPVPQDQANTFCRGCNQPILLNEASQEALQRNEVFLILCQTCLTNYAGEPPTEPTHGAP
jgi:RNase P subunit RPR2